MKGYWFFRRCLIVKCNLLSASAINWQIIFARPSLMCGGDPGYPLWGCFVWLREWCVWGQVNGLPRVMSWGLLLTPTPALVPAATSTRYCTPVCSPPTTTERMVASTDLLTWKRVSLARHQIWQRQTRQKTEDRQNSFNGGTLHYQKRLYLQQYQYFNLPYIPEWCRFAGQREEGPMTH